MEKFSVKNLNVTYNGKKGKKVHAVDDVSFELSAGDSLGIIGESGSGKSTMIHAFLRLLSPNTASIIFSILTKTGFYAPFLLI